MEALGYYNGTVGPLDEMKVPMLDRACFFGDGIYDASVGRNHVIFARDEHIDRFYNGLSLIDIHPTLTKAELGQILDDCLHRMTRGSYLVYWQMSRGTARRAHVFPQSVEPNLWVMIVPKVLEHTRKFHLATVEDTRYLLCNAKTLNILVNCLAAEKAKRAGCDEAIFHRGNVVTEGSSSNIHIISGGEVWTHPTGNLILPGISRAHLLAHCTKLGVPVREQAFTIEQMMAAEEVIVTRSSCVCATATHIDGVEVGGKAPELIQKLQDSLMAEFVEATKGE
jgi:D-alanine transaminase